MKEEMDTNRRGGAGSGLGPSNSCAGRRKKLWGVAFQGRTGRGGGRTAVECPRQAQLYASASEGSSWSPLYSRGKARPEWPAFWLQWPFRYDCGLSEEAVGRLAAGDSAVSALWRDGEGSRSGHSETEAPDGAGGAWHAAIARVI